MSGQLALQVGAEVVLFPAVVWEALPAERQVPVTLRLARLLAALLRALLELDDLRTAGAMQQPGARNTTAGARPLRVPDRVPRQRAAEVAAASGCRRPVSSCGPCPWQRVVS